MVTYTLAGKELELKLSYASIKWLEAKTGDPMATLFQNLFGEKGEKFSIEGLELFLTACVKGPKSQRNYTVEQVAELLEEAGDNDELDMDELVKKIQQAADESSFLKNAMKQKKAESLEETVEKAAKARKARAKAVK